MILRPVFVSNKENKFCNLFPSSFLTRTTAVSSIGAGARVSPRLPCGWPRHWYCREVPGPPSQALPGHCDRCAQWPGKAWLGGPGTRGNAPAVARGRWIY